MQTPAKFSSEISEVKSLLEKRLKQINQVKAILNLGDSKFDAVMSEFADTLSSFVSTASVAETVFIKQALADIHITGMQPVPIKDLEFNSIIATMHGKYKALTAAVLSSDYVPEFMQSVVKMGADLISAEAADSAALINNMANIITDNAAELGYYLDNIAANPGEDMPGKISASSGEIMAKAGALYTKITKLFNSLKKTNVLSLALSQDVISNADSILKLFGTNAGTNPALSLAGIQKYIDTLDTIEYQIQGLKNYGSRLENFEPEIKKLDLASLMSSSFSQMLNNGNRVMFFAKSAINAAKNGNAQALAQSVKNVVSHINYLKSQIGQISKQNIKNFLPAGSVFESELNNIASIAGAFTSTFPETAMKTMIRDVKTIIGIAESLSKNISQLPRGFRPSGADLQTITSRMNSKAASVIAHVNNLVAGLSGFPAPAAGIATDALKALKDIAPTPMSELAKGNVLYFKKSLDNPMMLTKIGGCQDAIHEAMTRPGIGAVELGMLSTLLDYVSGEAEREIMNNFVSDLDLQKSLSIMGLENYKKEIIDPMQRLLRDYQSLKSD